LITCIIFGQQYRSLNTSFGSFLHLCNLIPLLPRYSLHHPIPKHPQATFLSLHVWKCFPPTQNKGQNYNSVHLNFYIFGKKTERQKILHWMISSIHWLQSALIVFLHSILIQWGCSLIFKIFHPFKGTIIYLYSVTSFCILISRHDHVLNCIILF
jgi:hypothetical protein